MSNLEKPRMMAYARHMLVCVGPRCTEELTYHRQEAACATA